MRVRITFSKTAALRYIGNLDLHKIWERAARRAGLPLAYSQAFHPQAKIQLASPLPLGFSSRCELVDIRLEEDVDLTEVSRRLQDAMPEGIRLLHAEAVNPLSPSLQAEVVAAEYEAKCGGAVLAADPTPQILEFLASPTLPRERRGKRYDLRPLVEQLELVYPGAPSGPIIRMRLSAREGATGRPEEVLEALGTRSADWQIERIGLFFRESPPE